MKTTRTKKEVRETWERIESWLREHWQKDARLPLAATATEIEVAEAGLGVKLPREVRTSYQLHDGSGPIPLIPFGAWYGYPLLSLVGMVGQWKMVQRAVARGAFSGPDFVNKPKGPIRKAWLHSGWIPFVDNQQGDFLLIDMAPATGGCRGQIIEFSRTKGATRVIAESFGDLLEKVAKDLQGGKYVIDKGELVPTKRRS